MTHHYIPCSSKEPSNLVIIEIYAYPSSDSLLNRSLILNYKWGQKWGLEIRKAVIDVENVKDVWRRLTEDTKRMRYLRSGSEQGVWSIGHVVVSSLSDLKYSLTSCRFLNWDLCMMLMDKCFHVMEFPVLHHYSVFLVHLSFLFSRGILVLFVFRNEVVAGSTLHGVIFFILFYYKFIWASILGFYLVAFVPTPSIVD